MKYKLIETCSQCEHLDTDRVYTDDSWEEIYKWTCGVSNKTISKEVEVFDDDPDIPKWCPLPDFPTKIKKFEWFKK